MKPFDMVERGLDCTDSDVPETGLTGTAVRVGRKTVIQPIDWEMALESEFGSVAVGTMSLPASRRSETVASSQVFRDNRFSEPWDISNILDD